jgi:hypothetical protein
MLEAHRRERSPSAVEESHVQATGGSVLGEEVVAEHGIADASRRGFHEVAEERRDAQSQHPEVPGRRPWGWQWAWGCIPFAELHLFSLRRNGRRLLPALGSHSPAEPPHPPGSTVPLLKLPHVHHLLRIPLSNLESRCPTLQHCFHTQDRIP